PAVGSLLAMSFVGRLTAHIGTAAATRGFGWFFCAVGWLSGLATSLPMLCGLLLLWGIGIGGMDVSMNAQAVSVEKAYRRPLMSGFHAAWSLGSLFGAGVGTLGAVFAVPVVGQQGAFAGVLAVAVGWASRSYVADPQPDPEPDAGQADPAASAVNAGGRGPRYPINLRLMLLGLGGICAMLSEGSVADWSGVFLRDSLGAAAGQVGLGFAAFMAMQTTGRLLGDRFIQRVGRIRGLSVMAATGALGLALGLAGHTVATAVFGFAVLGLGLSIAVPVSFSAAADGRVHAGPAIAVVASMSYTGFLIGPTAIGFLAQATSVSTALWMVPIITAIGGASAVIGLRRST
ncbi:MAG: MFS transporter, partial [Actinomycetota bacterium]|nr:MFS transporter [Actinomycetota bacterium]